jgi:Putative peptidoglycan binding domain
MPFIQDYRQDCLKLKTAQIKESVERVRKRLFMANTTIIPNAYPALPVVPYQHTTVDMPSVYAYIKNQSTNINIQRALAFIFINESGWGNDGINNNYCGIQADGDPLGTAWNADVIATTLKVDSTGDLRRFCCFASWQVNIDYLLSQITNRQIYIGGQTWEYSDINVQTAADFALAYEQEWVQGDATYQPPAATLTSDENLYLKIEGLLPDTSTTIYKWTSPMMVDPVIGQIETVLQNQGYYSGDIDNTFGHELYCAVVQFQKANNLSIDGEVGTATLAALGISG